MELDFEKPIRDMEERLQELLKLSENPKVKFESEIAELKSGIEELKKTTYARLTPWQTVQVARHPERPVFPDFVSGVFSEFIELHGDRAYGDDSALCGGFATLGRHRVMLIGTHKGKSIEEKIKRNFGMAGPEGYRKALRLMRLAEQYGLPVVCLVDTPAAYPGAEAEARGQAEAIGRNLMEMAAVEVPMVAVITGEGGSGGALGIAVCDAVLMLSHAIYSVIPPEGCAAILWRDSEKAPAAAEALKLTAGALLELGIIDEIVPEPPGGAHRDAAAAFAATREAIVRHLTRLCKMPARKLLDRRFEKYASIGKFDNRKYAAH